MELGDARFSVDVAGLLEALTQQFPDPLLCVRELIQNAADAGARRIEVDVAYDRARSLVGLSVRDDGRGMGLSELDGYLTIGFSAKDPTRDRGRFGIGKLSPYALGIERMVVETSDGREAHRLVFLPDGAGTVERLSPTRPGGTSVRVFKRMGRAAAETLGDRVHTIARTACGGIETPLFVNGVSVNHDGGLSTRYQVPVRAPPLLGAIGVGRDPIRRLLGRGIVLESGSPLLGPEIAFVLDDPRLAPTLSRRGVRRDRALENLLRVAQDCLLGLEERSARVLAERVTRIRRTEPAVERALAPDDRAALEWLRTRLFESGGAHLEQAPLLETADGDLVSTEEALGRWLRGGVVGGRVVDGRDEDPTRLDPPAGVPCSRVPLGPEALVGFRDRGIPVLLLYRDLEDHLEALGLRPRIVEPGDQATEVPPSEWSVGQRALARRLPPVASRRTGLWARLVGWLRGLRARWPGRSGGRPAALDLDRLEIGFADLEGGEPGRLREGRLWIRKEGRLLLDREHPTIRDLVTIAAKDRGRAGLLLELLLSTDPELSAGIDPRHLEWMVIARGPRWLRRRPK